ncbi:MAG: hypothetical protein ABL893_04105, partial [Hyphomicrobium sp.]
PDSVRGDFNAISASGQWPNANPEETIVLEAEPSGRGRKPGEVRITAYHNTHVTLEADSPDGGFVVLNDIWQPWWFAAIDGADVPMLRANVLFRAVEVPAGRHTITFTFDALKGATHQLASKWGK